MLDICVGRGGRAGGVRGEDCPKRRISSVEGLSMAEQQLMERIMVGVARYLTWTKTWEMVALDYGHLCT